MRGSPVLSSAATSLAPLPEPQWWRAFEHGGPLTRELVKACSTGGAEQDDASPGALAVGDSGELEEQLRLVSGAQRGGAQRCPPAAHAPPRLRT